MHIAFDIPDLFLGFGLLVFAIVAYLAISNNWEWLQRQANPMPWLSENYVAFLLPLGFIAISLAIYFWIWDIRGEISRIISLLSEADEHDAIRNLAYATGALLAAVALAATIPFQLIKVWVNERLAKTTEQGHMTDRITKAVEQLGAEKTVWRDGGQQSVPNLEVRLGGIYALSRVARDSPRDHISIMEILCAYVRENFPRESAALYLDRDIGNFPKLFESTIPAENNDLRSHYIQQLSTRKLKIEKLYRTIVPTSLKKWSESFKPRSDLQAVIRVLGERGNSEIEKAYQYGEQIYNFGFRLNLANSNLQGVDFEMLDFAGSLFSGCSLDGALFRKTILNDAFLNNVSACGADFYNLELDSIVISDSQMELCNFKDVRITNSKIYRANLNGSFLTNTRFLKTEIHQVSFEGSQIDESLFIGGNTIDENLPLIGQINAFGASFSNCGMAQLDFGIFHNVAFEMTDEFSFILDESVLNFPEAVLGQQIVITSTSMEDFEAKWQAAITTANL